MLRRSAAALHEGLVGTAIGDRTRAFLGGVAWTAAATALSRALTGAAGIFAVRALGPAEFGLASLGMAAALWIQIPMLLGVTTALQHFLPRAPADEKPAWVAASLALLAVASIATLVVGFGLLGLWSDLLKVPAAQIRVALAWNCGHLFHAAATALLSAYERFRGRALVETAFSVSYPALLVALWLGGRLDGEWYVASMGAAYALSGLLGLLAVGRALRLRAPGMRARAGELLGYGALTLVGSAAAALYQSASRLVSYRHLDLAAVGVLSAYQVAAMSVAIALQACTVPVFLPIASRTPSRQHLFRKVTRLLVPIVLTGSLLIAALLVPYFRLLGPGYSFGWPEALAFAAAGGMMTGWGAVGWFLASQGRRGLLAVAAASVAGSVANGLLCLWLIPLVAVTGAGLALACGYAISVGVCYLPWVRRLADCA